MKVNKKLLTFSLTVIILLSVFSAYLIYNFSSTKVSSIPFKKDTLIIHYIDVGQGDSILIQINNKNLLIDAGENKTTSSYLKKQGIKNIDYIIATHPHDDHIGGIPYVLKNFNVGDFYAPKVTNNTDAFKNMILSLKEKNLKISRANPGAKIFLDKNVTAYIIAPNSTSYESMNNYSAVVRIVFNNTSFLFCGDAESLSEKEIISKGYNLSSDVIKIGHHGSNSSTLENFLDKVNPKVAIISCGKGNDYGHPHKETLNKLKKKNIILYRTDLDGTVVIESDGNKIIKRS